MDKCGYLVCRLIQIESVGPAWTKNQPEQCAVCPQPESLHWGRVSCPFMQTHSQSQSKRGWEFRKACQRTHQLHVTYTMCSNTQRWEAVFIDLLIPHSLLHSEGSTIITCTCWKMHPNGLIHRSQVCLCDCLENLADIIPSDSGVWKKIQKSRPPLLPLSKQMVKHCSSLMFRPWLHHVQRKIKHRLTLTQTEMISFIPSAIFHCFSSPLSVCDWI